MKIRITKEAVLKSDPIIAELMLPLFKARSYKSIGYGNGNWRLADRTAVVLSDAPNSYYRWLKALNDSQTPIHAKDHFPTKPTTRWIERKDGSYDRAPALSVYGVSTRNFCQCNGFTSSTRNGYVITDLGRQILRGIELFIHA